MLKETGFRNLVAIGQSNKGATIGNSMRRIEVLPKIRYSLVCVAGHSGFCLFEKLRLRKDL